jgi:hypothetical protein
MTALFLTTVACTVATDDAMPSTTVQLRGYAPTSTLVAPTTTASITTTSITTTSISITTTTVDPFARPDWLGTRMLPLRPDGHGEIEETPPELVDRQLETLDLIPPPDGEDFDWTAGPIPVDVLARSSWSEECPVDITELSYLTMSHFGFDRRFHTGEMIVNAAVADDVIDVFRKLHEAKFPIEQMRVIAAEEIDAHPTGDFNDTTSFVCRPAVGSASWSQHAYGLAIDINPFHNPYLKGDLVLPELASVYLDREDVRPGMIVEGDVVTEAFDYVGWGWGGRWNSLDDWMHFSRNGR